MEVLESIVILAAVCLAIVGVVNTLLMFEVLGRRHPSQTFRSLHKWLGWIFIAVTAVFFIFMIPKISHAQAFGPSTAFHAVFGLTLLPLIVWKPLIVRRYKAYMGILPVLGFTIMVVAFLVVALTAGPDIFADILKTSH